MTHELPNLSFFDRFCYKVQFFIFTHGSMLICCQHLNTREFSTLQFILQVIKGQLSYFMRSLS